MSKNIEDLLGPIEREKKISGTRDIKSVRDYRYVNLLKNENVLEIFDQVLEAVDPPIPTRGGAMEDGCILILPDGQSYFALSYSKDLDGWRQQIEQGSALLGRRVAKISEDKKSLVLDDGNEVLLSDCEVKFY